MQMERSLTAGLKCKLRLKQVDKNVEKMQWNVQLYLQSFSDSVLGNFLCSSILKCESDRIRDSNTEIRISFTCLTYL